MKDDQILNIFLEPIRQQLGLHLKQVILFGSRARGDFTPDSDYDCLVVVDEVSPEIKEKIYEITGEILYQHNELFAVLPMPQDKYENDIYEPFLMNRVYIDLDS